MRTPLHTSAENCRALFFGILLALALPACSGGRSASDPPQIANFVSSASTIFRGRAATLTPTFSGGTGEINNGVGAVTSGTGYPVSPNASATYTLTVTNQSGARVTADVSIQVESNPVAIASFAASPPGVNYGQSATVSWTLTGLAETLTLDGTNVLGSTSREVNPVRRQTYTLTATNPFGSQTRAVTIPSRGVDLFAGSIGGPGAADGSVNLARFYNPIGLATDSSGNLFVADLFNHAIRKISPAGVVTTFAGTMGASGSADGTGNAARFFVPQGITIDLSGNIYVADRGNDTIRKITPQGEVTTLAGSAGMAGNTNGTGNAARFSGPRGVVVDGDGNLFVADTDNQLIRKITPARMVTTFAGSGAVGNADGIGPAASFRNPRALTIDGSGNLYVSDSDNHTIRKITPAANVTTFAGTAGGTGATDGTGSAARFNSPIGISIDSNGNLFVADTNNNTIRKITSSRVVTTFAGSAGDAGSADGVGSAARFFSPTGVIVDQGGNIFVSEKDNHTIREITPAASVTTFVGLAVKTGSQDASGANARFSNPQGIRMDSAGNLYVVDSDNATIRKISPAGAVSTVAGLAGSLGSLDGTGSAARFRGPLDVAVDQQGNLYVADTGNHTIRKITPAGVVSTLAGLAGNPGNANGTGSTARFQSPYAVTVDSAANVYVADTGNQTIRKITPTGVVSTLAGSAGSTGATDGNGSAARFHTPLALTLDAANNIYVADWDNYTIRKVTPSGSVTTLAGLPGTPGNADGLGSNARFNSPASVAADSDGNVYVADYRNNTVRKVTSLGQVTTIAGTAGLFGNVPGRLPGLTWQINGIVITPAGDLLTSVPHGIMQITAPNGL